MHFDLLRPCSSCPFLRIGGVRLTEARVEEIAGGMLSTQGATFACHKTTTPSSDGMDMLETKDSRHCAGALIFAEKNENATQMMRIAERLGMYNPRKMMADQAVVDSVFDELDEMVELNRKENTRAPRRDPRKRRSQNVSRLRRKTGT
jgi:hypothetical protein